MYQIKKKLKIKYFNYDYIIKIFDKSHIFYFILFLLTISKYIKIFINFLKLFI